MYFVKRGHNLQFTISSLNLCRNNNSSLAADIPFGNPHHNLSIMYINLRIAILSITILIPSSNDSNDDKGLEMTDRFSTKDENFNCEFMESLS